MPTDTIDSRPVPPTLEEGQMVLREERILAAKLQDLHDATEAELGISKNLIQLLKDSLEKVTNEIKEAGNLLQKTKDELEETNKKLARQEEQARSISLIQDYMRLELHRTF
jgi:hypothetical protein